MSSGFIKTSQKTSEKERKRHERKKDHQKERGRKVLLDQRRKIRARGMVPRVGGWGGGP